MTFRSSFASSFQRSRRHMSPHLVSNPQPLSDQCPPVESLSALPRSILSCTACLRVICRFPQASARCNALSLKISSVSSSDRSSCGQVLECAFERDPPPSRRRLTESFRRSDRVRRLADPSSSTAVGEIDESIVDSSRRRASDTAS